MGRPEKPVNQKSPARAKLAEYLRDRRHTAGLTYQQMSAHVNGKVSKSTFERAASGESVPLIDVVETFILVTATEEEKLADLVDLALSRGMELWVRARRATRAPYYVHKAPDPSLISSRADLSRALRHQHIWAGYPTPGEMERESGVGQLPSTTTRRIIKGDTLPVDPIQAVAFLKACYVAPADLEPWLAAMARVLDAHPGTWTSAHMKLCEEIQESEDPPPLSLAA